MIPHNYVLERSLKLLLLEKWIFLAMTKTIMIILRDLLKVLAQTNLQHNLLHFFIRTLKLTNQDQHHFSGVVVGILCIHKRDQVPNGFEESSKTLKKKRQHLDSNPNTLEDSFVSIQFSFHSADKLYNDTIL